MTRLIDVSLSVGRKSDSAAALGKGSTAIASARFCVSSTCRLVVGEEALALQGLHFGSRQGELQRMPQALLHNLAGGSFHAWCCAAVVHSALELLAHGWAEEQAAITARTRPRGAT